MSFQPKTKLFRIFTNCCKTVNKVNNYLDSLLKRICARLLLKNQMINATFSFAIAINCCIAHWEKGSDTHSSMTLLF